MKNYLKFICVLLFLAVCGLSLSFNSEAKTNNLAANFSVNTSPRSIYVNNCARCHGADGKSDTALGRQNEAPDISGGRAGRMSNGKLTRIITNGAEKMPAFGKKLTKAQIASVISYIKGL